MRRTENEVLSDAGRILTFTPKGEERDMARRSPVELNDIEQKLLVVIRMDDVDVEHQNECR